MSWISPRPRGHHWVRFRRDKKSHTVRLGKVPKPMAVQFKRLLDELIATRQVGVEPSAEIRGWLERMPDGPRRTLTTAGLAEKRQPRTLGELCRRYLEALEDRQRAGRAKPSTLDNAQVVVAKALEYFGTDRPIGEVDKEEAESYRNWVKVHGRVDGTEPLAETTAGRVVRRTKEIFEIAVERNWIEQNPFKKLRGFRNTNPARDCYVPRDVIDHVIASTADLEVRLILAIARYCGIRGPSEVQRLELGDFDIETGTVTFRSPKTEHHDGHEVRLSPLWPQVVPHVREIYDAAAVGQTLACPNMACVSDSAVTARVKRAVVKAGVTLWPKFMPNIRASCEHDLFREHPIDDVCTWLGHSPEVALRHYRRTAKVVAATIASDPTGVREAREPLRSSRQSGERIWERT